MLKEIYLVLLCYFLHDLMALEIIPSRGEVEYFNPKYISSMNVSVRKNARRGPYIATLNFVSLEYCGNNVTMKVQVFEHISGRYIPTIFMTSGKMCNLFDDDIIFGKILKRQQAANFTCPIPAGENHIQFQGKTSLGNFPVYLSFTYDSVITQARCDLTAHLIATKELVFKFSVYATFIQKPKEKV